MLFQIWLFDYFLLWTIKQMLVPDRLSHHSLSKHLFSYTMKVNGDLFCLASSVLQLRKNFEWVWNSIRMSKWWQNDIFEWIILLLCCTQQSVSTHASLTFYSNHHLKVSHELLSEKTRLKFYFSRACHRKWLWKVRRMREAVSLTNQAVSCSPNMVVKCNFLLNIVVNSRQCQLTVLSFPIEVVTCIDSKP